LNTLPVLVEQGKFAAGLPQSTAQPMDLVARRVWTSSHGESSAARLMDYPKAGMAGATSYVNLHLVPTIHA
jgi:hypothetical protein